MPCIPNTTALWLNGKIGVNVKGLPALMDNCKCLQEWLSSVWGKADVELKCETDDAKAVKNAIKDRNGVYIILGNFDTGASGATTLWLGGNNDALGGLNYVRRDRTVYFWELKGEKDVQECLLEGCKYYSGKRESNLHQGLRCSRFKKERPYEKIREMLERNATKADLSEDERKLYGIELKLFESMEGNMNVDKTDFKENDAAKFRFALTGDGGGVLLTNIKEDAIGHEGLAPYQATIHEIWHYMDYLAGKRKSVNAYSLWYGNESLFKAIKKDFDKKVKGHASQEAFCQDFYGYELQVLAAGAGEKKRTLAYLFDIIEGISVLYGINGFGTEYKTPKELRENGYWNLTRLSSEYFAGIGCVRAVGDTENMNRIKYYFPEAYEIYEKIIIAISEEQAT